MKTSVIIPTFAHKNYILETIASVLKQACSVEIIVIDDGSTDGTAKTLQPLVDSKHIHYYRQANSGVALARNRGLSLATCPYVLFLDDDDLLPDGKLLWQEEYLETHPECNAVAGNLSVLDNVKSTPHMCADKQLRPLDFFSGNPVASPGQVLIRKAAVESIRGFNPKIWGADDLDLWIRLATHTPMHLVNKPGLIYRVHANNASENIPKMIQNIKTTLEAYTETRPIKEHKNLNHIMHMHLANYAYYQSISTFKSKSLTISKFCSVVLLWCKYAKFGNITNILSDSCKKAKKICTA